MIRIICKYESGFQCGAKGLRGNSHDEDAGAECMLRGFGLDQYFRSHRMPAKESARIIELRGRKPVPADGKG
jgi:hypothetical protein